MEPFELLNTGTATLLLYGAPSLEQQGGGMDFYMEGGSFPDQMPSGGNAGPAFAIRFAPTGEGLRMATLTVNSSDPNENPYTITLVGTGLNGGQKIIDGSELTLLSPNGDETLEAGTFRDIRWKGGERAKCVKIEYSTDNGTTYRTIADRVANIGTFPWLVPEEVSGSCLVRISDADGAPAVPAIIAYEFNFRVSAFAGAAAEGASISSFGPGFPTRGPRASRSRRSPSPRTASTAPRTCSSITPWGRSPGRRRSSGAGTGPGSPMT